MTGYAEGGFNPAKHGYKFNEAETGWERFISLARDPERNRAIADEAYRRLEKKDDGDDSALG